MIVLGRGLGAWDPKLFWEENKAGCDVLQFLADSISCQIRNCIACVADALNLLYIYIYKWFRRVRGPAATQATTVLSRSDTLGRGVSVLSYQTICVILCYKVPRPRNTLANLHCTAKRRRKIPLKLYQREVHTMSLTSRYPPANTIAFGGVATGNIKANEHEMVAGSIRYHGWTRMCSPWWEKGRDYSQTSMCDNLSHKRLVIQDTSISLFKALYLEPPVSDRDHFCIILNLL